MNVMRAQGPKGETEMRDIRFLFFFIVQHDTGVLVEWKLVLRVDQHYFVLHFAIYTVLRLRTFLCIISHK